MKQLTDDTWDVHEGISVVMFSSPWAGPCNLVRPGFEEVARRYGNQIDFREFNVDDNPNIPQKFGVRHLPLFMVFRDGKPEDVFTGAVETSVLFDACEAALDD